MSRSACLRLTLSLAAVLLLSGAAYVGGVLWGPRENAESIPLFVGFDRAKELPDSEPAAVGVLARRQDNTLFITTHVVKFDTVRSPGGTAQPRVVADGPTVEILITHDTRLYRDVTEFSPSTPVSRGNVQQVVELGSLQDVDARTLLTVWGERRGARLLAQVVLINQLRP